MMSIDSFDFILFWIYICLFIYIKMADKCNRNDGNDERGYDVWIVTFKYIWFWISHLCDLILFFFSRYNVDLDVVCNCSEDHLQFIFPLFDFFNCFITIALLFICTIEFYRPLAFITPFNIFMVSSEDLKYFYWSHSDIVCVLVKSINYSLTAAHALKARIPYRMEHFLCSFKMITTRVAVYCFFFAWSNERTFF